jgi:hypothetical protein
MLSIALSIPGSGPKKGGREPTFQARRAAAYV